MLSKRLKEARKNKKLTQEQLALKVKTQKTTISNYETGYSTPSNDMLIDLSRELDVSVDFLLGRTDDPLPRGVHNNELAADNGYSIAFLGGAKEVLDEEEAAHLEKELEMFRAFKEKRKREREQKDK